MDEKNTAALTATLSLADRVRALALEGLHYARDPYDRARYQTLLQAAVDAVAVALTVDSTQLRDQFLRELGCITPKIGVDGAVFDRRKRLLVLQRADGTGWCLPCGWVDVGEGPAAALRREVAEETGLKVEIEGYLSLTTKGPGQTQHIQHQVNVLVLARCEQSHPPVALSHEHLDFRWIERAEIASLTWHPGHEAQARGAFLYIEQGGSLLPV